MRTIGICTSSRSERHLVQALADEMNNGKYDLKAELIEVNSMFFTPLRNTSFDILREYSFLILPTDRMEMMEFALSIFKYNIPFCHYIAGSQSYSHTYDDINRWMISLMANFCFAESPEARHNLIRAGIPEDRILITGTSHFDGITMQDIEANKPKDVPIDNFDIILYNPLTTGEKESFKTEFQADNIPIIIKPNEDNPNSEGKQYSHLEFLWLLHHADRFISNSSAGHYELPYLQKYYGSKCKWINPSQRNKERTPIPPEYCRGASKIIADWCNTVDLKWLKTPKRLFGK